MAKRILVAVPAAVLFIYCIWARVWYFHILMFAITILMQFELLQVGKKIGFKPNKTIVYLATIWIYSLSYLPSPWIFGGLLFLTLCIMEVFDKNKKALTSIITTPFFSLFIPLGTLSIIKIREFGSEEAGITLTISVFLLIWGNDIFAYFGGRHFGKHPLSEVLSPNKTVEGFLFGFAGGGVGILLAALVLPYPFPLSPGLALPMVFLGGIFGPCGDLLESKMKRVAGIKDSSSIIPGHGGFLDRFDALILTAPVLFIYLTILEEFSIL